MKVKTKLTKEQRLLHEGDQAAARSVRAWVNRQKKQGLLSGELAILNALLAWLAQRVPRYRKAKGGR